MTMASDETTAGWISIDTILSWHSVLGASLCMLPLTFSAYGSWALLYPPPASFGKGLGCLIVQGDILSLSGGFLSGFEMGSRSNAIRGDNTTALVGQAFSLCLGIIATADDITLAPRPTTPPNQPPRNAEIMIVNTQTVPSEEKINVRYSWLW